MDRCVPARYYPEMDELLSPWSEFNVAMLGATAALAGLVIVAASVNIAKIIESGSSSLIARLASGIASLLLALIASGLALVPAITPLWFGVLLLGATIASAVFQVHAARMIFADPRSAAPARTLKAALGFLPVLAYLAAATTAIAGHPSALYLCAAGCMLAIISAVVVSWVALVEVLR